MRRGWAVFAFTLAAGAGWAGAAIHSEAGTAGAPSLSHQTGVRMQGMGNAALAHFEDLNALYGNPAGIGFLRHIEVLTQHRRFFQSISQSNLGFVIPFSGANASNVRNLGVFGMGVSYSDYGSFAGRDAGGAVTSDFSADDWIGQATYGKLLTRDLSVGFTGKFYRFGIADVRSDGAAFDAGALYRFSRWGSVGAAATNLGQDIRFHTADSRLPRAYGGGVAFYPFPEKLTVAADAEASDHNHPRYRAGVESWISQVIAVRAGYDSTYDAGTGLTAGFGLRVNDLNVGFFPIRRFSLDYAFVPSSDAGDLHYVSLAFRFGDH